MLSDTSKKPVLPLKFSCKSECFEKQQLNFKCGVQYNNSSFLIVYKCSSPQLPILSVLKTGRFSLKSSFFWTHVSFPCSIKQNYKNYILKNKKYWLTHDSIVRLACTDGESGNVIYLG